MNTQFFKRILSIFLCLALLVAYIPLGTMGAESQTVQASVTDISVDPASSDSWEKMMGTDFDGNRYAGRVWVDRSVYKNGDTAILNSRGESGSSFQVSLEDDEAFQVIFSALGSTMSTTSTVSSTGPMDVILVLDNSVSMNTTSNNVTRMEKVIDAANDLLANLMDGNDVRLGIVAYSQDAAAVLPFGVYNNGVVLKVNSYTGTGSRNGVITAYDNSNRVINNNYKSNGYANYTNTQAGFDMAMEMLQNATNTQNRKPVVLLLTDGAANTAVDTLFDNDRTGTVRQVYYSNDIDPMIALSTLLSAAYNKAAVEKHYGKAPMIYGIGVDLSSTDGSNAIIDPAKNFNTNNNNAHIREAYNVFKNTWLAGNDVSVTSGSGSGMMGSSRYTFRFGHEYPQNSGVTSADVAANINYVDTYYPVSSANLQEAFTQIYEKLSSNAFNPISSTTSVTGGTGVEDTPLVYVDFIGQFMEIKEIQTVTLFGASYDVINNADGTYTVDFATGTNPTTNESWNTSQDIVINVTTQTNGSQKLEIRIYQEILPIIMEKVVSETVGNVTTATITEFPQDPLRIYYTVGLSSDLLLPNGSVDASKLAGYEYINPTDGTASFYLNQFGVVNPATGTQAVSKGDSHVGFKPSAENRFYYHQANQGVFTKITSKADGSEITIPTNEEYGIVWDADKYNLSWMTYQEYLAAQDTDTVYNYVTYYRPTPSTADAANAAEEVTYLVYNDWKYVKESIAFYDATTGEYLNNGEAIAEENVESFVAAYMASHPDAQIYAVLGVGSLRTSRLHNMIIEKAENVTQTATQQYTPEYTYDTASQHNGNDVVVWLGNNGKLTVEIDTGILLTKSVTEAMGNPNDTYALTVTLPAGVAAAPVVVDINGSAVPYSFSGNVLTVNLKAEQTAYITGIPGGTECQIGEIINGDYYIANKTDSVVVPLAGDVFNGADQFVSAVVTNSPNKYGNLYITKEITSDFPVPTGIQDTAFEITVSLGSAFANKTFKVVDGDHTTPYDKTADAAGDLIFQIKAKQTIEILSLPAGTVATITETVPGNHFAVSYRTRNHSGTDADTDNVLTIPAGGNATAVVLNHYTPTPVSVDLDVVGTKNFTAEGNHNGGTFVYKVQKWTGSAWEDVSGKTAQTPYAPNEAGTKTFLIENVLSGITYTQVGSYAYQVMEVTGNVENVTYDRSLYTFNVTVTDNGGQLIATVTDLNNAPITDGSYEVTFTNTYHTAPVSIDIVKLVDNQSGDPSISKAGFSFTATATDANWTPLTGNEAATLTVFSDAAGEARVTATYTEAGNYYYLLSEVSSAAPGWTYSGAQYRIAVTVTEDNGNLTASLNIEKVNSQNARETAAVDANDATQATVSFVNTYNPEDASVNLDGKVFKDLTGKALEAGQFTFYVYGDGDRTSPILTGTNGLGNDVRAVDFNNALTFATAGKYQYDVVESIPTGAVLDPVTGNYVLNGMCYDATIYDLVVEVTNDTATGKLVASYYFEDAVSNAVTFYNSYKTTPTQYTLSGTKILHGRAPRDKEFTFELYEAGLLKQTVANKADGSFSFATITYTEAGVYTYTIKEALGNVAGVRYDGANAPITVTVTVTDTNGVLSASASIQNRDIRFENTYTPSAAQVSFTGTKTLVGDTLADNTFTFKLYQTDTSFDITADTARLIASQKNVNGAFTFTEALNTTGTFYFVVVEDAAGSAESIVYDRTQHKFAVKVSDIGDGQLKAVLTNVVTGVSSASAAAVSTDVAFTNATFGAAVNKEVYLADDTLTEINGQQVNPGDTLTYYITYTNYTGENVVVDIMDAIPENTAYVENSASHNATYALSQLNWTLNVEKSESVTVSFKVTVHSDLGDATIENQATATDGVNTYKTQIVTNYTEAPVTPPVPEPEIPDNPKTGDSALVHHMITVMLASCSGLVATSIYGRKKKEDN